MEAERRIAGERHSMEGERKQVTVLYVDVAGSMELTERLGAERWGGVLDRFLAIACDAIDEFGGNPNQFHGDGLMAVFGAPRAQEDHAHRGCLAALELQRRVSSLAEILERSYGIAFSVRCGLSSGEVIVGSIGAGLDLDFAPIGNAGSIGKRIESLASPGSIALNAQTASLARGAFELRELGAFAVRGLSDPQRVYELLGPAAERDWLESVDPSGLSRFVGRDAEREQLDAALERTLAGRGGAVGIRGEPGIGKSRLAREFARGCRARGLRVDSVRLVAYGRTTPLLSVLKRLRSVEVGDRRAPEVIVIEDLHWIEAEGASVVEELVGAVGGTRTLLVATFRPGFEARWTDSLAWDEIALAPLAPSASDELLAELLGGDPSLDEVAAEIRSRTSGNPFFVEEVVRALAESGRLAGPPGAYRLAGAQEAPALPAPVQTVLDARIDRLGAPQKKLLRAMSVIGREVDRAVLEEVTEMDAVEFSDALSALMAAGFIVDGGASGRSDLAFGNSLTRDVAYASQLSEPRRRAHAAVAAAIERADPDRLDERAALLAHHRALARQVEHPEASSA